MEWPSNGAGRSFPAIRVGLFDMSGNVWEWTQDCWNEHYGGAPVDGTDRQTGHCLRRVVRGGSWFFGPISARCAARRHKSHSPASGTWRPNPNQWPKENDRGSDAARRRSWNPLSFVKHPVSTKQSLTKLKLFEFRNGKLRPPSRCVIKKPQFAITERERAHEFRAGI